MKNPESDLNFLVTQRLVLEKNKKKSFEKPIFSTSYIKPPCYSPFKVLLMLQVAIFTKAIFKGVSKAFAKKKEKEQRRKQMPSLNGSLSFVEKIY